jgi:hypothetical protein
LFYCFFSILLARIIYLYSCNCYYSITIPLLAPTSNIRRQSLFLEVTYLFNSQLPAPFLLLHRIRTYRRPYPPPKAIVIASNYNTCSNCNCIPGRSETIDEPTLFSTPGSSQDTDAAGGLAYLRELREFQAQNPGFSTTAVLSGTPGILSRQYSIIPGTGTSRETGNTSDFPYPAPARPSLGNFGQGFALLLMPNRDFLSNKQAQSLEAQRRTYFDLQIQLLQAEIDKAAVLVARAKADIL